MSKEMPVPGVPPVRDRRPIGNVDDARSRRRAVGVVDAILLTTALGLGGLAVYEYVVHEASQTTGPDPNKVFPVPVMRSSDTALPPDAIDITKTPLVVLTPTVSPTATQTATATNTETETPVPTPEGMTLEDWKGIFTGSWRGLDGKNYNIENVFNGTDGNILTDSNEVSNLPIGSQIMLFMPSGEIRIWMDPEDAGKMVANGAVALIGNDNFIISAFSALHAAENAYNNGKTDIFVQFGESSYATEGITTITRVIPQTILEDGTIATPVVRMPKHFSVIDKDGNAHSAEEAGITDPDKWMDQIIKGGYIGIAIVPIG